MTTLKITITLLAIVSIGLTGMTMDSFAVSQIQKDERPWVENLLNHGTDPTTKIGYDCEHNRMNFGC